MKGPLTRRRERRILAALQALGPLTDFQLSDFLGTPSIFLKKPLMNLVLDRRVTATRHTDLIIPGYFVWAVTDRTDADG